MTTFFTNAGPPWEYQALVKSARRGWVVHCHLRKLKGLPRAPLCPVCSFGFATKQRDELEDKLLRMDVRVRARDRTPATRCRPFNQCVRKIGF